MDTAPPTRTTVVVDAWHLGGASAYRGIGTYLRRTMGPLTEQPDLRLRALTRRPDLVPPGVEPVVIHRWAPARFARREHELRLPRDLARAGGDLAWSPAQDPPRRCSVPFVQTLHDATPLLWEHPELAADAQHMRRLLPRYRAAVAYIANSAYTADTCSEAMGLDRDRISVAHLAADPAFVPSATENGRGTTDDPSPAVLYVGEYGPHKGFAEAFAVAAGLADAALPHRLRMVGRVAPWWAPTVDALVRDSARPDRIDVVGFTEDLVGEYQRASALVMTSRHEGFGLPLVEAMACGTPVVAFANSSLVEVVGEGGTLVPDGDVGAAVEALVDLLGDSATWNAASRRALARASCFDWARTAAIHGDVFRAAHRQA